MLSNASARAWQNSEGAMACGEKHIFACFFAYFFINEKSMSPTA